MSSALGVCVASLDGMVGLAGVSLGLDCVVEVGGPVGLLVCIMYGVRVGMGWNFTTE